LEKYQKKFKNFDGSMEGYEAAAAKKGASPEDNRLSESYKIDHIEENIHLAHKIPKINQI